ncbi:MAG: DUF167 domain-containing protein [Candidatus Gastranaerophilales bacterium]|nr:DUF167 domain-containing protein [Candidatus Gastranaerophilales bacterium]
MTFSVKVIPNSSASQITEITEDYLKAKLNSPPIENKANKEVINLLAKSLDIPKSSITLIYGDKNKLKTFLVPIKEEELRIKVRKIFE